MGFRASSGRVDLGLNRVETVDRRVYSGFGSNYCSIASQHKARDFAIISMRRYSLVSIL